MKNIENFGDNIRLEKLPKGFWLKQPPLIQKRTNRYVLPIHQNNGFANARHITQEYANLEKQKKEMGNMGYVGT